MKKFRMGIIVLMTAVFYAGTVSATHCEIEYKRMACPGKEKISYKKCNGSKTCSKHKEVSSVSICRELATKSCANKRYNITKSKVITVKYDGKAILTQSGKKDFCLEYANVSTEFNQCDK